MLLIVCEILIFFSTAILCVYSHTTDSLQTLYSLLWTLYRLSTLYYGSLQTLYSLYRLSTDSLQPHCSSAAAVLLQCCCSAVQNIKVTTGTTALQALLRHCCGTAAAPLRQTGVC